ncbi:MAG: DUF4982 domain-containing protein, partial [Lachnospiraceae bacterium]|nr:DUF4982 domain-containing protein [Lachnospiraceae bacterium]
GCDGVMSEVEVYAKAYECELFLNKRSFGRKKLGKECRCYFKVPYEEGVLSVKTYDDGGFLLGEASLKSAGKETVLQVSPEDESIAPGEILYLPISYTDNEGILKPMEKHNVSVSVKGGSLLGLGNACSYNKDGYDKTKTFTYYGQALAVVKADEDASELEVEIKDERDRLRQIKMVLRQG